MSSTRPIPVLLTSSVIAYDRQVALTDQTARLQLALDSVAEWLRMDAQTPLVLCDGSNFDFSEAVRRAFPAAQIECLAFDNDQERVRLQGRGYGEGEIVRYAVAHSELIRRAGCFAKCTSKLWVRNFAACARQWNDNLLLKGVFNNALRRDAELEYIDTRFYIASVDSYTRLFADAHLAIDVLSGYGLEQCFHAVVLQQQLQGILLPCAPVIEGVGVGTGHAYRNSRVRLFKEALRLAVVRRSARFRALFSARRSH